MIDRFLELGLRAGYHAFAQKRIASDVRAAYADRNSPEAEGLRDTARVAFGLSPGNRLRARARMRIAHDAQKSLQKETFDLGVVQVGFERVRIHARPTDENSSRVYIDGFDENLPAFDVYRRVLRPGNVAIDVGANLGIHSLVMAACVGLTGRVLGFEASPAIAALCSANLTLNDAGNIVLRNIGIGSQAGVLRFEQYDSNIGMSRFSTAGDIELPVTKLDSEYSGPVHLIKIDVEGMELDVLRGAHKLLEASKPALVLEWNEWTHAQLKEVLPYPFTAEVIPVDGRSPTRRLRPREEPPQGCNVLITPC